MNRNGWLPALAVCALAAAPAQAQQSESGGTASLIVSATTAEEHAHLGITGGLGYRFNRIVGLGLELTSVPSFEPELPELPVPLPIGISGIDLASGSIGSIGGIGGVIIPAPAYDFSDQEGHATIFTTNLRLDIPTGSGRVLPYLVGGAGVAHVQDEFTLRATYPPRLLPGLPGPTGTTLYLPSLISSEIERSSTDMAVTLGGGVGFRAGEQLRVEADLRYLAVLGARDLQIGRFGVGVSYRF